LLQPLDIVGGHPILVWQLELVEVELVACAKSYQSVVVVELSMPYLLRKRGILLVLTAHFPVRRSSA